jgi:hypothetical protein
MVGYKDVMYFTTAANRKQSYARALPCIIGYDPTTCSVLWQLSPKEEEMKMSVA